MSLIMSSNQQLIEQFIQALAQAPFDEEERTSWEELLPDFTDEELVDIIADLRKLTEATTEIKKGVRTLVASVPPDRTIFTIDEIRAMPKERLEDPAVAEAIRVYVRELLFQKGAIITEAASAFEDLLRSYGEEWKTSAPDVLKIYNDLFALLQFHRLGAFNKAELRELFQRHFLVTVKNEINILGLINDWMVGYLMTRSIAEDFDVVIQGIRGNEEKIGDAPIIREDGREVEQTIHNWLIEFDVMTPSADMPRGALEEGTFLSQNQNAKKLSTEDRALLRKVIEIFDSLLFPGIHEVQAVVAHDAIPVAPLTPPGRERHELPRRPLAPPIAREPIPSSVVPVIPRSATVPVPTDTDRVKKIDAARARLRETGKEAVILFFDLLSHPQGMTPATPEELTAGLMILAQDNALERAITDAKIHELFVAYLRTKNAPDLLEGFRLTPTMPKFMSLFFQWVLQEKGKLSENDAAHIGARIASMLKKRGNEKYARIAYLDAASGQFKWS